MMQFHAFFLIISAVSIARVAINLIIFMVSVNDANQMKYLTYEIYAILTELGSCIVLLIYYKSVTYRN